MSADSPVRVRRSVALALALTALALVGPVAHATATFTDGEAASARIGAGTDFDLGPSPEEQARADLATLSFKNPTAALENAVWLDPMRENATLAITRAGPSGVTVRVADDSTTTILIHEPTLRTVLGDDTRAALNMTIDGAAAKYKIKKATHVTLGDVRTLQIRIHDGAGMVNITLAERSTLESASVDSRTVSLSPEPTAPPMPSPPAEVTVSPASNATNVTFAPPSESPSESPPSKPPSESKSGPTSEP